MSEEPLYGYSVKDITQLEVEIEELKRKRTICIVIGAIIAGIAVIAGVVFGARAIMDVINASTVQEIKEKDLLVNIVLTVLELIATGGEALAIAGGVTSHVKAKRREAIVANLKRIKSENPELE